MKFQTRSVQVDAMQYTGDNLNDLEMFVEELTGRQPMLSGLLDQHAWVVVTAGSYQVLPNSVFLRVYEPVGASPWHDTQRSCFGCIFHEGDRCTVFDERIESETYAAQDCHAFTPVTY